jgi:hypothetical protein
LYPAAVTTSTELHACCWCVSGEFSGCQSGSPPTLKEARTALNKQLNRLLYPAAVVCASSQAARSSCINFSGRYPHFAATTRSSPSSQYCNLVGIDWHAILPKINRARGQHQY